ncbi:MAG TPA: hypothetical protein VKB93_12985, partial [Thermoanaerobaculia bacterium]|nr:hypothetical protein [Thermoanaerobaculia bacterium]
MNRTLGSPNNATSTDFEKPISTTVSSNRPAQRIAHDRATAARPPLTAVLIRSSPFLRIDGFTAG